MAITDLISGAIPDLASSALSGIGAGILDALGMPATFNGIPIQMFSCTITKAPQTHVHLGAYWKYPVVESLGNAPTQIKLSGFIDPSLAMIERPILELMITLPVAGILTLPSGIFYARCMSASFTDDISNIVEVNLDFIQVNSLLGALGDLFNTDITGSITSGVSSALTSVSTEFGKVFS